MNNNNDINDKEFWIILIALFPLWATVFILQFTWYLLITTFSTPFIVVHDLIKFRKVNWKELFTWVADGMNGDMYFNE